MFHAAFNIRRNSRATCASCIPHGHHIFTFCIFYILCVIPHRHGILTARCIRISLKTVKTMQNCLKTEKYICHCFYTWNYFKLKGTKHWKQNPKYVLNVKLQTADSKPLPVCCLTSKKNLKVSIIYLKPHVGLTDLCIRKIVEQGRRHVRGVWI